MIGHCRASSRTAVRRIGSTCAILAMFLMLGGCSRDEALEKLNKEIPAAKIDIVHARFPCRSPDLHVFGYRFSAITEQRESGYGDICWDFARRQWTWQIMPEYGLSRLNPPKRAPGL
jgi:hypothetical protein